MGVWGGGVYYEPDCAYPIYLERRNSKLQLYVNLTFRFVKTNWSPGFSMRSLDFLMSGYLFLIDFLLFIAVLGF